MARTYVAILASTALFLGVACSAETDDDETFGMTDGDGIDEADETMSDEGLSDTADALTGRATVGATVTTTAKVNFREGPSSDHDVIRALERGTAVTILSASPSNGFYQVRHGSNAGYVHGAYLTTGSASSGSSGGGGGRRISTKMVYLGSCEFLGNCASRATRAAWRENKTIYYGCDGRDTCSDNEPYISVPRNGIPCGAQVEICLVSDPTECITATVREKSDSNQKYEASVAVARGLGWNAVDGFYPSGGNRACSGSLGGDGRVTIKY